MSSMGQGYSRYLLVRMVSSYFWNYFENHFGHYNSTVWRGAFATTTFWITSSISLEITLVIISGITSTTILDIILGTSVYFGNYFRDYIGNYGNYFGSRRGGGGAALG